MENKIEQLEATLESIVVETALNTAHLETLTIAFRELAVNLLPDTEAKSLQRGYYHTLYEKSNEILNQPDLLNQKKKATKALFELHCFVQEQLKNL